MCGVLGSFGESCGLKQTAVMRLGLIKCWVGSCGVCHFNGTTFGSIVECEHEWAYTTGPVHDRFYAIP